ncbi:MAG: hypothetical protein KME23_22435 [Goleter apudmare HA4340-LM2]|nr:hypothetical protein [Goleter apudmare HA4340-LM2]
MNANNSISETIGETTDVEVWLSRAGLKFADLGNDDASAIIRRQWREYQAAVRGYCILLRQPPEQIQLTGDYARLRIPDGVVAKYLSENLSICS